ncbi:hypothetical protein [Caldicellulosiruptor owensensis]|nr:hypothetical protein [Caldicellulosiruptor owensensis]
MYFATISSAKDVLSNLNNTVEIYINSIDNLTDVLYKNGVVQDKDSFEKFLKQKKLSSGHLVGKKVTFLKAMSYEEIFNAVYESCK